MSTYLVMRRMSTGGKVYQPNEVLVDPNLDSADLLLKRGYIVVVPDNYTGPQAAASGATATGSSAKKPTKAEKDAAEAEARAKEEAEIAAAAEAEAEALAKRPDAVRLAAAMEAPLEEVMALSDEEYEEGLEAYPVDDDNSGDGATGSNA